MSDAPRVAVVGHVEWVEFVRVDRVPEAGEIAHGGSRWEEPAGGGAVAAVQLLRLAGHAELYTALGDDELGRRALTRLGALGLTVHVVWCDRPTRRAITLVDDQGERTIITIGERLEPNGADDLPWSDLADADGVYFTAGDEAALRAARRAGVLVASPRTGEVLKAGIQLDALILSARDHDERRWARELIESPPEQAPRLIALTEGVAGGDYRAGDGERGRWEAVRAPGPAVDSYGCGDSFAAGVTFGMARGDGAKAALELGARCGATCMTGRGPYERQLGLADL